MPRDRRLTDLCNDVLRQAVRRGGRATKQDLTNTAVVEIDRRGGPSRFGIGRAWLTMALKHIVMSEITIQMRQPLSTAMTNVMKKKLPVAHAAMIEGATTWLAQEVGAGALHIFALSATPDEWITNGELKHEIARAVQKEARRSTDIGLFLRDQGYNSLEDMLS